MQPTVPAFKAALLARLLVDTTIQEDSQRNGDLLISWGNPSPEQTPRAIIVVGDMGNYRLEYVAAMTQANETYDVEVYISILDYIMNDKEALWTRVYALAAAVHANVLAWGSAGFLDAANNKVVDVVLPEITSDQNFVGDSAHEAAVTLILHVTARIS